MVITLGNSIIDAYTGGVKVKSIYSFGEKVWPVVEPVPANNEIWYTTYSGDPITLTDDTGFGVNLVSNIYDSNRGVYVLEFDGVLTRTGSDSFKSITDLKTVYLSNTVEVIGLRSFFMSGLQSIYMPSVVKINGISFYNCLNLNPVLVLPSTCKILTGGGFGACFEECTSLTDVIIPAVCEYLGPALFRHCTNLSNVIINSTTPPEMGGGLTSVYEQFKDCSASLQIIVPAGTLTAYQSAPGWSNYASRIVEAQS